MIAVYSFLTMYVLWVFYLAVMGLKRARDAGSLTKWALVFGYPVLIVGYAMDIFVNVTILTVLFLEWPHETLVTSRLKRHIIESSGWRETMAAWICGNLLNAFDPNGKHC